MPTTLSGQLDLGAATEGTALPSTTDVASFTVNNTTDAAGAFTATIEWGDGSTTTGTVVGANGSFTVEGGHTYPDEGSVGATVTVTRTADNSHLAITGTVDVADIDHFSGFSAAPIIGNPNQALTNAFVADFLDSNRGASLSDFIVSIDWGDGTTSAGGGGGGGGDFTITGAHTYATAGQFTVTTTMSDPGGATAQATTQAQIGFGGNGVANEVTEGTLTGVTTATFVDNAGLTAAGYIAVIEWGDGTSAFGTVTGSSGSFSVSEAHVYADEGKFTAVTKITRQTDNAKIDLSGAVTVDDAALQAFGRAINGDLTLSNVTIATFTDANTRTSVAGDFTTAVDWGDGTTSAGTVSGSGGGFTISGSHTYAQGGQYTVKADVKDAAPGLADATAQSTATINLAGAMALTAATEHVAINNATVATFNDSTVGEQASAFSATINWADGSTSAGSVSGGPGPGTFSVKGSHTYADEGNFQASVTLTRTADHATSTISGAVAVAEHDSLTAHSVAIAGSSHQALSNVTVATFTDTDTVTPASDLVATIDWGDGTVSAGAIVGANGAFVVNGSHTYATPGQDHVVVTVSDDAPGTATATATSTASIAPGAGDRNDFNADGVSDILWRAGGSISEWLMTAGKIGSNLGVGSDSGLHFLDTGDFNADGHSDVLWRDDSANVVLWTLNNAPITTSQTVANITSDWQNQGVADFDGDGHADVLWRNGSQVALWTMNGANITANQSVTTNLGSEWHIQGLGDFNGDGHSDVLLRSSSTGQVALWTMNGAQIATDQSVSNPGLDWHVLGTGDFSGDGKSDVLLRNDSGQVVLWTMNGNQIAANQNVSAIDASWHLQGIGDYTGDGHADVLWRNDSGQLALWEMNGNRIVSDHTVFYANGAAAPVDQSWSVLHHAFDLV